MRRVSRELPRTHVSMTQTPAQLTFTDEQQNILDAFAAGRRLSIEACAGSGKTTILRTMAERSGHPGLYLAYNRHVAKDARGVFPTTTRVATANSLPITLSGCHAAIGSPAGFRTRRHGSHAGVRSPTPTGRCV